MFLFLLCVVRRSLQVGCRFGAVYAVPACKGCPAEVRVRARVRAVRAEEIDQLALLAEGEEGRNSGVFP
jgi:hypothetical protein